MQVNPQENPTAGWKLNYSPRRWQAKAFDKWQERSRGVVSVVTGGGKTIFAEMCLLDFFERVPDGRALVVVPTVSLQDQWYISLQDEMGVLPEQLGVLGGGERPRGDELILIAVINTARSHTRTISEQAKLFLIVDECHRAGSESNSKALEGTFAATLGLSATPVREYDDGFSAHVEPRLGEIIYEYTYREAAEDGVISPFELLNVEVGLLSDEQEAYDRLSRRVAKLMRSSKISGEAKSETLKRLLQRRAAVSATATMRIPVAVRLVDQHRGERCVVFHERVDAADKIAELLRARGHRVTIYHAKIGADIRRDNLRLFRRGVFDVLVCCRALDEGINVPEASVAVIASGTASQRQRIQRLGRILRTSQGKEFATIYTLFATPEERGRLAREAEGLEGISNVSWLSGRLRANG